MESSLTSSKPSESNATTKPKEVQPKPVWIGMSNAKRF